MLYRDMTLRTLNVKEYKSIKISRIILMKVKYEYLEKDQTFTKQ